MRPVAILLGAGLGLVHVVLGIYTLFNLPYWATDDQGSTAVIPTFVVHSLGWVVGGLLALVGAV